MSSIILGLCTYFFPVNALPKQNRVMRHRMRKPRGLQVIRYAAHLVDLNDYLDVFPGENISDKICELNEILLNSMPNICSKQAYVQ